MRNFHTRPAARKRTHMARIVGAIATSAHPHHRLRLRQARSRTIPSGRRSSRPTSRSRTGSAEKKPDVLFMIYNDHVTSFFFDHYSPFALGIGEAYARRRTKAAARARCRRSRAPGSCRTTSRQALMADEFDMSLLPGQARSTTAASRRCRSSGRTSPTWPGAIVPLQMGVLAVPGPVARSAATSWASAAQRDRELPRRT